MPAESIQLRKTVWLQSIDTQILRRSSKWQHVPVSRLNQKWCMSSTQSEVSVEQIKTHLRFYRFTITSQYFLKKYTWSNL